MIQNMVGGGGSSKIDWVAMTSANGFEQINGNGTNLKIAKIDDYVFIKGTMYISSDITSGKNMIRVPSKYMPASQQEILKLYTMSGQSSYYEDIYIDTLGYIMFTGTNIGSCFAGGFTHTISGVYSLT